jgi:hypothetical protein
MKPRPDCRPHPAEANKAANMEAESRLKNVPLAEHPGRRYWLCASCGNFHPTAPE